ncbi:PAS and ANTAR domain-containing protein [Rhodococcus sp. NPDC056960]|uniref:PAS and ANTAR domain-containing protein n=1 Tax=Rhodococcus sp. NPDC056960 TaxID=3345982 RepID=UPI00362C8A8D
MCELDAVVETGAPQRVGSFRFFLDGHRWEWSDTVAVMHGYTPGEVTPTTELLLSHKHPDDKMAVTALLERTTRDGEPFSSKHRILDTSGRVRHIVVVGDRMLGEHGQVIGTSGFYIDVTAAVEQDVQESVDGVVAELEKSRAVIEQAKGMLMFAYGICADRAFDVLTWHSQQTNTKLRVVAERLVAAVATAALLPDQVRARFDHLLLTTHRTPR